MRTSAFYPIILGEENRRCIEQNTARRLEKKPARNNHQKSLLDGGREVLQKIGVSLSEDDPSSHNPRVSVQFDEGFRYPRRRPIRSLERSIAPRSRRLDGASPSPSATSRLCSSRAK